MKLESGKTYLTAEGKKFTAIAANSAGRWECSDGTWRDEDGGATDDAKRAVDVAAVHNDDEGMTLRDQFAMAALAAMKYNQQYPGELAKEAYMLADAMLEQRRLKL